MAMGVLCSMGWTLDLVAPGFALVVPEPTPRITWTKVALGAKRVGGATSTEIELEGVVMRSLALQVSILLPSGPLQVILPPRTLLAAEASRAVDRKAARTQRCCQTATQHLKGSKEVLLVVFLLPPPVLQVVPLILDQQEAIAELAAARQCMSRIFWTWVLSKVVAAPGRGMPASVMGPVAALTPVLQVRATVTSQRSPTISTELPGARVALSGGVR